MKRLVVLVAVGTAIVAVGLVGRVWWKSRRLVVPPPASGAQRPAVGTIYGVSENLYVVPGGGGNTAVFVTAGGVILVDTKYAERYEAMLDQVRTVTSKPILNVINTHIHTDHTGGNSHVPSSVDIIMQANAARSMEKLGTGDFKPARPLHTYKDKLTLLSGQDAVDLYYFGPAHTDGDTFVVFRSAGVMHAGDVFPDKTAPIINAPWGGSGLTYEATIARAATEISGVSRVITGHGPVYSWDDFVDYGEYMRILLDGARSGRRSGKRPHQVVQGLTLPAKFKDYEPGRLDATLVEIYNGLTPWWQFWK